MHTRFAWRALKCVQNLPVPEEKLCLLTLSSVQPNGGRAYL